MHDLSVRMTTYDLSRKIKIYGLSKRKTIIHTKDDDDK